MSERVPWWMYFTEHDLIVWRKRNGWSLLEAAHALEMPAKKLRALENGRGGNPHDYCGLCAGIDMNRFGDSPILNIAMCLINVINGTKPKRGRPKGAKSINWNEA